MLSHLPPNWDTYGALAPNQKAIDLTKEFLLAIDDVPPTAIMPSVENGIGLTYFNIDIEFLLEIIHNVYYYCAYCRVLHWLDV